MAYYKTKVNEMEQFMWNLIGSVSLIMIAIWMFLEGWKDKIMIKRIEKLEETITKG